MKYLLVFSDFGTDYYLCDSLEQAEAKAVSLVSQAYPEESIHSLDDIREFECDGWGGAVDIFEVPENHSDDGRVGVVRLENIND